MSQFILGFNIYLIISFFNSVRFYHISNFECIWNNDQNSKAVFQHLKCKRWSIFWSLPNSFSFLIKIDFSSSQVNLCQSESEKMSETVLSKIFVNFESHRIVKTIWYRTNLNWIVNLLERHKFQKLVPSKSYLNQFNVVIHWNLFIKKIGL